VNVRRWRLVAGLLAASAAQADVICQERFQYPGGLARFLVSERTWVVSAEDAERLRSPVPRVPLLAVRVGGATRPLGGGSGGEGQGSADSTGREDPGTKALCPDTLVHDVGTREPVTILEESP
jgi:hypothetical protein